MGVLGWSEDEFWNSDPRTYAECLESNFRLEEQQQRVSWEQTRWMVSVLLAPHNKGRQVNPRKLIELPWDRTEETKPEHYERVAGRLGKKIKK